MDLIENTLTPILNFISELMDNPITRVILCLIFLCLGWKLIGWAVKKLSNSKMADKTDPTLHRFFTSAIIIALRVILIACVVGTMGVQTASITTVIASAGAAIALALQGGLSNIAGGITIMFLRPFSLGDFITVADVSGTVVDINLFYTRLRTPDNRHITVPNASAANSIVTNVSVEECRRLDFTFGVAYGTDTELVRQTLLEIADKHELVVKEEGKEPFCRLSEFGDSSISFVLRVWAKNDDYWTVNFDINEAVKAAFEEKGIEIPFPQRDIHIISK